MIRGIEKTEPLTGASATAGTWIQITFTLDPEHYRALWDRAEEAHRTIPNFVREIAIDSLSRASTTLPTQPPGRENIIRRS